MLGVSPPWFLTSLAIDRSSEEFDALVASIVNSLANGPLRQTSLTQLSFCLDHYWDSMYVDRVLASSDPDPGIVFRNLPHFSTVPIWRFDACRFSVMCVMGSYSKGCVI